MQKLSVVDVEKCRAECVQHKKLACTFLNISNNRKSTIYSQNESFPLPVDCLKILFIAWHFLSQTFLLLAN